MDKEALETVYLEMNPLQLAQPALYRNKVRLALPQIKKIDACELLCRSCRVMLLMLHSIREVIGSRRKLQPPSTCRDNKQLPRAASSYSATARPNKEWFRPISLSRCFVQYPLRSLSKATSRMREWTTMASRLHDVTQAAPSPVANQRRPSSIWSLNV